MTYIIPTPAQFVDPNSDFNTSPVVQQDPVEEVIKKIFELHKAKEPLMYVKIGYPKEDIWEQVVERITAYGWHIDKQKVPDEPMGTMLLPGFTFVVLKPQDGLSKANVPQKIDDKPFAYETN